jgi:hypothetical protein
MLSALSLAVALLADGADPAGAAAAQTADTTAAARRAAEQDSCPPPSGDSQVIVVCTQRPQGYRIDPDIMEAKRELHSGGRPVKPGTAPPPDCATVGPLPCAMAGINLIGAALTAAEMARRLAKGEEIGSMFKTDPQPNEYELYKMAKARREADEAEQAAAKKAKAKANAAPVPVSTAAPQQPAAAPSSGN